MKKLTLNKMRSLSKKQKWSILIASVGILLIGFVLYDRPNEKRKIVENSVIITTTGYFFGAPGISIGLKNIYKNDEEFANARILIEGSERSVNEGDIVTVQESSGYTILVKKVDANKKEIIVDLRKEQDEENAIDTLIKKTVSLIF